MRRCDVVVVGAGAMGSSAAWWLARRGRDVVVLERFEQGHRRGSSHGGSRIFRFAYDEPDYVRLAQAALPLWRELEEDAGATLLETTGGVDHGEPALVDLVAAALEASGARFERVTGEEAGERWPGMRFGQAVVVQPDAGRALADRTVRALQDRAGAHGADLRFEEGAERIEPAGEGVVVRTSAGEYRAPVAIVAAGAWNAALLSPHLPLPPLTVTREQVFHFAPVASDTTGWPSFIHHRLPWIYGLQTPGQGVKVAEHHTGAVTDPEPGTRSFEVDAAGRKRVTGYVREWFPGLDPEPVDFETCLYTSTPDEHFVVDRRGPLVVASPCSGHGFKFTPVIGRILADLSDGLPAPVGRFALPE